MAYQNPLHTILLKIYIYIYIFGNCVNFIEVKFYLRFSASSQRHMKMNKKKPEKKRKRGFQKFRLHVSSGSKPLTSIPLQTSFPSRVSNKIPVLPLSLKFILKEDGDTYSNQPRFLEETRKDDKVGRNIKRRMNSFMGFRAFYTRNINAYETQIHLSKKLANVWRSNHKLQAIWSCYTEEYNNSDSSLTFVSWLENKMGIKHVEEEQRVLSQTNMISHLVVEDVFSDVQNS